MNRRDALTRVAWLMGGAVIGGNLFLTGCKSSNYKKGMLLTADQIELLDEVGETIIPTTTTPGAKAAKIGEFMDMMVNDCYETNEQAIFKAGLETLEAACKAKFNNGFLACTPAQRTELLNTIDKEAKAYAQQNKDGKAEPHYFKMIKELTLLGYFTSEVGATKQLRYVEVPGKLDGAYPYKKGDKAFAL
ncbi:MAG TPA: twin-arginine translocation pathway signal protein [Chitinophagaceae bacterium]|jgi:hypothetical protein|nr:twin-arginine translocation pathway signal protein [Chitinophagaceae bacterium]HAN37872.1 twin-arginine translocation pathway signal protein [Chitinophagaceae bacterium]